MTGTGKIAIRAGWDDVPHLSQDIKEDLLKSTPPHLRDARSKGIPSLGSGAIFPVPESDVFCSPLDIPKHWPRGYALDVGWNRTAALWGALDRTSDTLYCYAEHYRAQAEPSVHAAAIRARGTWIPGVIDPAAAGRSQKDGEQLISIYQNLGLSLTPAKNAVEAGLHEVWERLSTGRIKIFETCRNCRAEYILYRRDDKGRIVKENDHLMDCLRYLVMSGIGIFKTRPVSATGNISQRGTLSNGLY